MFDLQPELEERERQGLYRRRLVNESAQGPVIRIDGADYLSFCSNDYLGLANHSAIKQAAIDAITSHGVGSGAAHLVNGHHRLHHNCEQQLADFTGRDRALLFSTGYMANLAIGSALCGRGDVILQDRLNHASLIDAARISDARLLRYHHLDYPQLQRLLGQHASKKTRCLVMTDSVFSMDGDEADLKVLASMCDQPDCALMVDDAHGFGVLGDNGAGSCAQAGLDQRQVPVLMATLGKAMGVSGAFVAGSEALIETLVQKSRSYIFTTASPPALSAAVMAALSIVQTESWRRQKLADLVGYLRQQAASLPWPLMPSSTPIQPVLIGDNHAALNVSRQLLEHGLLVTAIRPPTVAPGTARLRITLSAAHDEDQIDRLVRALQAISRQETGNKTAQPVYTPTG
jgi:8-amino-7-oxononanoate synthase